MVSSTIFFLSSVTFFLSQFARKSNIHFALQQILWGLTWREKFYAKYSIRSKCFGKQPPGLRLLASGWNLGAE